MPVHLLTPPVELPKAMRTIGVDGKQSMNGAQALSSLADLYGVCGGIRSALIGLQEAVRTAEQGTKPLR